CFVAWGSKKRVVTPLAILSFAITVATTIGTTMFIIGYKKMEIEANQVLYVNGQTIVGISLVASAAFNLALTLLT
ncbi:hypothetical protein AAF712_005916, partial [Marasmius tenuissimus]